MSEPKAAEADSVKPVEAPASPAASAGSAPVSPAVSAAAEETNGEKKLSNKELKELKKKEKAAKRAAKKGGDMTPEQQQQMIQQKIDKKKQQSATNTNLKKQLNQTLIKDESAKKKTPPMFSHLETREQRNASSPSISHIVHPSVLTLSLKYSTYKVVGSTNRLRKMLEAFKDVISDYHTPENTTLTRHLTGHLSHQIEFLRTSRPLSTSMGNAIRWLKQEISHISIDTTEAQAKEVLCQKIDDFISEKIDLSDRVIVENASKHIANESTILTYGHSTVLEELFKYCAVEENKKFKLIVVDSRPLFEGKKLLNNLADTYIEPELDESELESIVSKSSRVYPITKTNIELHYVLINGLSPTILERVDCLFLGAHAMLSNGRLYSRVGSSLVAMMCHTRNIPVITCCESIKFSDKVQLDSVTTNELGDPRDLMQDIDSKNPPQKKSYAFEQFIHKHSQAAKQEAAKDSKQKNNNNGKKLEESTEDSSAPLDNWEDLPNLNILNIMYDLTPPNYINKVVTEFGALPPSSVPVILREYKNT